MRVVQRSLFMNDNGENLPAEMVDYVAQLSCENGEMFRFKSDMCIQDPFDLSHNLTKATQSGTLSKFVHMCKFSITQLQAIK